MKNSTPKKRKFKFNFIDIILLVVILAAVVLLAYIFMSGRIEGFGSNSMTIEYEVSIMRIREEFRGNINVGDKVVDSVKLMEIGEITNVQYSDSVYIISELNSTEIRYPIYPEHLDMTMTIRAEAVLKDGLYMINGYHIAVGELVSIRVPNFTESGYCTTIREVK